MAAGISYFFSMGSVGWVFYARKKQRDNGEERLACMCMYNTWMYTCGIARFARMVAWSGWFRIRAERTVQLTHTHTHYRVVRIHWKNVLFVDVGICFSVSLPSCSIYWDLGKKLRRSHTMWMVVDIHIIYVWDVECDLSSSHASSLGFEWILWVIFNGRVCLRILNNIISTLRRMLVFTLSGALSMWTTYEQGHSGHPSLDYRETL